MKIFLIGLMGSGKSHFKQLLATKFKTGGYDLDQIIETVEEKSISEIFETEGEAAFRKTEAKLLRWFGEKKSYVLATGGGTACFHENMDWMNQQGITVWLNESIDVLVERLEPEKAHRPLIQALDKQQLSAFLQKQLADRTPFYSKAKIKLSGTQLQIKQLIQTIQQYA
jgi:shikimate kinase